MVSKQALYQAKLLEKQVQLYHDLNELAKRKGKSTLVSRRGST